MTRLLLFAALALLLPACDSGGSANSNDLVGTWRTQSVTSDIYVTSSVAQTARDPLAAGTGSVVVSGALTGTLRFAPLESAGAAITGGLLRETAGTGPPDGQTLIRFAADGTPSITRDVAYALVPVAGTAPYTFSPTAITFSGATFRSGAAGSPTATATGRLEFVQRPLAAGRESLASRESATPADFGLASITFDADGAYRSLGTNGAQTGTWVATDDGQLTLSTATGSTAARYEVRDSRLTLTVATENITAEQVRSFEPLLGITNESLTALRAESSFVFGRAAE